MNNVVISGTIHTEIQTLNTDTGMRESKFRLKNNYFRNSNSTMDVSYINCIAYGSTASYIENELYQGCKVIVTGRLSSRTINVTGNYVTNFYIIINTISILEQEEYL